MLFYFILLLQANRPTVATSVGAYLSFDNVNQIKSNQM